MLTIEALGQSNQYKVKGALEAFPPPYVFLEKGGKDVHIDVNALRPGQTYVAMQDSKKYALLVQQAKEQADSSMNGFLDEDKRKRNKPRKVKKEKFMLDSNKPATTTDVDVKEMKVTNVEKKFSKPWSKSQAQEMKIYRHLQQSGIAVYSEIPTELPEQQGLEMRWYAPLAPDSPSNLQRFFVALIKLLREIHKAGVICCDLKPERVRKTAAGEPIIVDFGISVFSSARGITLQWASADRLLGEKQNHFVDDLEAACRIARFWICSTDIRFGTSQRSCTRESMEELFELLEPSGAEDWLDDHLRYIVSRGREDCWDESIYELLERGDGFHFSIDDFRKEFDARQPKFVITTKKADDPPYHHLELNNNDDHQKRVLLEQVVRQRLPSCFAENCQIDLCQFSFNQVFSLPVPTMNEDAKAAKEEEEEEEDVRMVTEWEFVHGRSHGKALPRPKNEMTDAYGLLSGGQQLVGEVWNNTKTLEDSARNLQSNLFPSHRPIHTLHYFGHLLFISGGFVLKKHKEGPPNSSDDQSSRDGNMMQQQQQQQPQDLYDKHQMTIPEFLAVCIGSGFIDLGALCAAGRVAFVFDEEFASATVTHVAATVRELQEELKRLRADREKWESKQAELERTNAIMNERLEKQKVEMGRMEVELERMKALLEKKMAERESERERVGERA